MSPTAPAPTFFKNCWVSHPHWHPHPRPETHLCFISSYPPLILLQKPVAPVNAHLSNFCCWSLYNRHRKSMKISWALLWHFWSFPRQRAQTFLAKGHSQSRWVDSVVDSFNTLKIMLQLILTIGFSLLHVWIINWLVLISYKRKIYAMSILNISNLYIYM